MQFLLAGLGLGFGAGLAPGPLQALVISVALSRGFAAGARVAASPLVSDVVVIVVSLLVVRSIPDQVVAVLGVVGGVFVVWLGIEAVREAPAEVEAGPTRAGGSAAARARWSTCSRRTRGCSGSPSAGRCSWRRGPTRRRPPSRSSSGSTCSWSAPRSSSPRSSPAAAGTSRPRGLRRAHLAAGALLILTGVLLAAEFARTLLP